MSSHQRKQLLSPDRIFEKYKDGSAGGSGTWQLIQSIDFYLLTFTAISMLYFSLYSCSNYAHVSGARSIPKHCSNRSCYLHLRIIPETSKHGFFRF